MEETIENAVVDKIVERVVKKVKPEFDDFDTSGKEVVRCSKYVNEVREQVESTIPEQIQELEKKLDAAISNGHRTIAIQKEIDEHEGNLKAQESWLKKQDSQRARSHSQLTTLEQQAMTKSDAAKSKLSHAVQRAVEPTLKDLNAKANRAMSEIFEAFEQWDKIVSGLMSRHMPHFSGRGMGMHNHPINCGEFISTIYADNNKLGVFKKVLEALNGDMARGKWVLQDKFKAKATAENAAANKIYNGNLNRSISMKVKLFKENAGRKLTEKEITELQSEFRAAYIESHPRSEFKHTPDKTDEAKPVKRKERTWHDVQTEVANYQDNQSRNHKLDLVDSEESDKLNQAKQKENREKRQEEAVTSAQLQADAAFADKALKSKTPDLLPA